MHAAKLILNATVMGGLNLAAYVIGFWIFQISAGGEQLLVQGTAAVVVGIGLVVGWLLPLRQQLFTARKRPPGGPVLPNWVNVRS